MAFTGDAAPSPPATLSTSESSTLQNRTRPVREGSAADTSTTARRARKERTVIAKFGGSSLADSERIAKAAASVARVVAEGGRVVVVVSAMGKTTDTLLEILHNPSGRTIEKHDADDILSMGERTSARVFAATLKSEGVRVRYFDPDDEDWPIITDDNFSDANPILTICEERIKRHVLPLLEEGIVPVIAGFVGRTRDHQISTIGRGGSDTTAFILARALKADEVVLVTDSDGIMTADPKLVPEAKRLESVDVNTLVGMADSGKKFIHRKALKYKDPGIDVRVINYSRGNLEAEGTRITGSIASELEVELAAKKQAMALTVVGHALSSNPKIISELTEKVKEYTELLGLSANSNSIILYASEADEVEEICLRVHSIVLRHPQAVSMTVRRGLAYLRVKGVGLEETPGVVGKISETLRVNGINIFGILTITSSILIFVDHQVKEKAIRLIKDSLGVGVEC
jgi:aspartate kinase